MVLAARDRRTLILGACVISALVAGSKGVPLARQSYLALDARIATLRNRVAFVREAQRHAGELRDSLRARMGRLNALNAPRAIPATSAGAAMLGAVVERLAAHSAVRVETIELRADSSGRKQSARVAVRITAEGDVNGLLMFLRAIERQPEAMVVRTLSVTASDPLGGDDKAEILHFDVSVDGLAVLAGRSGQ